MKQEQQFNYWLLRFTYQVITWIRPCLATRSEFRRPTVFLPFLRFLDKVYLSRGEKAYLIYIKKVRSAYLGYLSGNKEKVVGVKVTRDGIPVALGDLVPIVRGSVPPEYFLPVLNTILWSTRALNIGKLPDLSTISEPASVQVPTELGKNSSAFWRATRTWPSQRLPRSLAWKKYRMTTKSGPNGQALASSLRDLYCLPDCLIRDIKILGGEKFRHYVSVLKTDTVQNLLTKVFKIPSGGKIRKISYFPDKEDKVRVIGILDYFSQEALFPLHKWLYRVLKRIPQDCTFNQGSFKTKLNGAPVYYSIDLTAATDRFPISTIGNVLRGVLPQFYVDAWLRVIVKYPFHYGRKEISYSVGNPMGAYSSWASFAVTNHYLVWESCRVLGKDWSKLPYCLLGDDIVIGDKEVGEYYIHLLDSLGVQVSSLKTHKSEYFYEFAKRLIYKSHEIRPFPISAIKERKKKYYLLLNLLREESKKGWVFEEPVSIAVGVFYTQVIKFRSKRVKPIILKCEVLDRITQVIRGSLPADDVVNYVVRKFGLQMPCFTTAESEKILRMFALALFEKSLIPNPKSRRPLLGTLSTQLVIDLTSEEEFYSLLSYPGLGVEIIPILLVQGLVEEKYLLAKRGLIEYSVSGKDDWQLDLRSITFPLTDDVFVIRGRDLIIHAASRLSRTLVSHLQSIRLEDVLDHHDEVIYL